jgi:hypothetical protein
VHGSGAIDICTASPAQQVFQSCFKQGSGSVAKSVAEGRWYRSVGEKATTTRLAMRPSRGNNRGYLPNWPLQESLHSHPRTSSPSTTMFSTGSPSCNCHICLLPPLVSSHILQCLIAWLSLSRFRCLCRRSRRTRTAGITAGP